MLNLSRYGTGAPAWLCIVASALLLGGCAETGGVAPPATGFTPATRPADKDLVGMDARALQRQFGKPRLDIRDPTARKLQFANGRCILDAYLYPPGPDKEPLVTYVEARSATGGGFDGAACARALRDGK